MDISDEISVGSRIILEAIENEDGSCRGCFFDELVGDMYEDCCKRIKCTKREREDNKSVIFKLVENGK